MNKILQHKMTSPWVRTTEPLLWLGGAGHESRGAQYYHDAASRKDRTHLCLQLTLDGTGYYQSRRGHSLLGAGSAWLDVIPGPFQYGTAVGESYELVYVSFTGTLAMRWHRRISKSFGNVFHFGKSNAVAPLMLSIVRSATRDRYLASAELNQLLMTVLSSLHHRRLSEVPRVMQAIGMIESEGRDRDFNVTRLAVQMDVSREHLGRLFKAALGVTPLDYLTQHRLRLSVDALRNGDEKLESLARQCGFSGANYLCRAFRRQFHVTPAEFRARPWLNLR